MYLGVTCPHPQLIQNSQYNKTIFRGHKYLDTVMYFCLPGYEVKINDSALCTANRTWAPPPNCAREL